jgi:RNA polymerase sigma-70 factor (ECF subfamily)
VAVVLRDVLTFDYAEIAETVGVPIGTVRSRIARGRSLLARQLVAAGNSAAGAQRPTEQTPDNPRGRSETRPLPSQADPGEPTLPDAP